MDLSITTHPVTLAFVVALPLFGIVAKFFGASFKKIAKWYCYIATLSVIIVMNSIFFPFIGGKDYFFRFAVELSLIAFVLFWAFEAKMGEVKEMIKAAYKKPIVVAVTVFLVVFLLACVFAFDIHAAFWSNYERGEGGFQMIHYYLFFLLLTLLLTTEDDWKNIFRFSIFAAGIMIIYGLFGQFSVAGFIGPYTGMTPPTGFWNTLFVGRFEGSLGNPAYVAPYLIFSMFFGAYLWLKRKAGAVKNSLMHVAYGLLVLVFLIFFILSQTRGAFLGLGAGIFVMFLYFAIAGRGSLRKWSVGILALGIILGGGVFAVRNASFLNKIPAGRLLQISFSDATAQTRLMVWGEAWKGFLERPILGWGPENFTTVFDKFFNPNFYVPNQGSETWYDRAHSVFFDYLSETGILGLLSYLGIFVTFAWEFLKKERHVAHEGMATVLERGMILAVPVAYLVQGVAIFDVLPMYLVLFLFMAFASYFFAKHQHHVITHEHHG